MFSIVLANSIADSLFVNESHIERKFLDNNGPNSDMKFPSKEWCTTLQRVEVCIGL